MSSVCVVDLHVLYYTKCCDLLLCCAAARVAASNLNANIQQRINSQILKGKGHPRTGHEGPEVE
jgi:hypothetical protein